MIFELYWHDSYTRYWHSMFVVCARISFAAAMCIRDVKMLILLCQRSGVSALSVGAGGADAARLPGLGYRVLTIKSFASCSTSPRRDSGPFLAHRCAFDEEFGC